MQNLQILIEALEISKRRKRVQLGGLVVLRMAQGCSRMLKASRHSALGPQRIVGNSCEWRALVHSESARSKRTIIAGKERKRSINDCLPVSFQIAKLSTRPSLQYSARSNAAPGHLPRQVEPGSVATANRPGRRPHTFTL